MPLKRILEESRSFGPGAAAILLEVYDRVVAELGLNTPDEKERAAKLIIRLAQDQTDLNAIKLRDGALKRMLKEGGSRH